MSGHYTQQPSSLSTSATPDYTHVHGGGFVTRKMLEATLDGLREQRGPGGSGGSVLVDLRHVAGYEATCLRPAHEFLHQARSFGLTRIAVLAPTSVMRTASRLVASAVSVDLRTFAHEQSAHRWLRETTRA